MMMCELDRVVLVQDLPGHGLEAGDVGTVVHVYGKGEGYEVEFIGGEGETVAEITLRPEDIRPMQF